MGQLLKKYLDEERQPSVDICLGATQTASKRFYQQTGILIWKMKRATLREPLCNSDRLCLN